MRGGYYLPRSATWWSGVAMIAVGILGLIRPEHGVLATIVGAMFGVGGDPATLIGVGAGLIGLRAKMERG